MEASTATTSPPSRISGVTFENDTLVDDQPGSLYVAIPNGPGASGNQITDVTVRNSILYEPSGNPPIDQGTQPVTSMPPDVGMNSLISGPGWAGSPISAPDAAPASTPTPPSHTPPRPPAGPSFSGGTAPAQAQAPAHSRSPAAHRSRPASDIVRAPAPPMLASG